ncbi:MAG: MCE family protein [Micromonosporaceae bacterium]|nr:MCE family protein [Micromonosporaceae bacterium]
MATLFLASTLTTFGAGDGHTYKARFTNVAGLLAGDDVRIAGVQVGKVTDIALVDNRLGQVTLVVDDSIRLPKTVEAKIRYRNLVGQRYISLTEGPSKHGRLAPNGTIPLSQTEPSLDLTLLFNGFRPLLTALTPKDINKFSYEIIQVLEGEGGTVESLLSRTASLTNTLADRDEVIGRVIDNLNQVLGTLNARDKQLAETISQLQAFVSGLAKDRKAIGESLGHIGTLADETSKLLKDARPALKADIAQLRKLAVTLNANKSVINNTLARLPVHFATMNRVASYGSWFNFFLCDWDGRVNVPGAGHVTPATFHSQQARCQRTGAGD